MTVRIIGLDEFGAAWDGAIEVAKLDLIEVSLEAAAAGIEAARADHPYTDRTGHLSGIGDGGSDVNSHAIQTPEGEADMVWPVEYAGYVDKGTKRSAPYPFTPQARERAEAELQRKTQHVAEQVARRIR